MINKGGGAGHNSTPQASTSGAVGGSGPSTDGIYNNSHIYNSVPYQTKEPKDQKVEMADMHELLEEPVEEKVS